MSDCKVKCLKGPRGPQGPQGPQGEDGLCIEFAGENTNSYDQGANDEISIAQVDLFNVQPGDIVLLQASSNWEQIGGNATEIIFTIRRNGTDVCEIRDSNTNNTNDVMTSFHCLDFAPTDPAVTYDLFVSGTDNAAPVSSVVNGFFTALLIRPNP